MRRLKGVYGQIADFMGLREAALLAARGKRGKVEVAEVLLSLESVCLELERELEEGRYRPSDYRVFFVYDRKPRQICAAPFRDRVVHHAVCRVLEPRLEASLIFDTYACRKGKGTKKALERAQAFSRGGGYVLHLDIEKYFASIKGEILLERLGRLVGDKRLMDLLRILVEHRPEGMEDGLPIGNLTSQWFANVYLSGLDHWIKRECGVRRYLRYMDDMLLFGEDKAQMWAWKAQIEAYLREHLGLRLKESETRLCPTWEGFGFLGFRVYPRLIRFGRGALRRFIGGWRDVERAESLGEISEEEAQCRMRGLLGHARMANACMLRRSLLGIEKG